MVYEVCPIVFSTDDNYALPTAVAIKSIIEHYSGKSLTIIILYKDNLSCISKGLICQATYCKNISVTINYIDVGNMLGTPVSHISHISSATYYRLALPELLPNYNRCLYLDGDIVVTDDICELLNMEFYKDEYIAGVRAVSYRLGNKDAQDMLMKRIGIPNFDTYVNAGVLLINLKEFRENKLSERMRQLIDNDFPTQDQDIINLVCFGHIKIIKPRYNVLPLINTLGIRLLNKVYSIDDIKNARKEPCIIHYADKEKPWKYKGIKNGNEWNKVYSELCASITVKKMRVPMRRRIKGIVYRISREIKAK